MAAMKASKKIEWPVVVVFREFAEGQHGVDMEMTAYERNRMYTLTQRKGDQTIETTFRFEPVHGGTRVTVEFDSDSAGVPPMLFSPGWKIYQPHARLSPTIEC